MLRYLPLIVKNCWRNRRRTVLTVISIGISMCLLGVLMNELDYPVAPLVLGFILGPMAEDNLRRGLMITAGDPSPFFTRPISAILFVMLIGSVIWSTIRWKSIRWLNRIVAPATAMEHGSRPIRGGTIAG